MDKPMADVACFLPEGLTSEAKRERERFLKTYRSHLEKIKKISLSILIWGPGANNASAVFQKREEIRRRLIDLGHNAMFSEEFSDLTDQKTTLSQKTLEFAQAEA